MSIRRSKIALHDKTIQQSGLYMTSQPHPVFNDHSTKLRFLYLAFISTLGLVLLLWSLIRLWGASNELNLVLLVLLAAAAEIAATFVQVGENKMAYEVGTAVSIAAIPLFGPWGAVVVVTLAGLSFWLYNTRHVPFRGKAWEQLTFNIGMHCIAIFIAGLLFGLLQSRLSGLVAIVLTWVVTAVVYDQINFWLLTIILRLVRGQSFKPLTFWRENRWAMLINVLVLSVGGFMLAFAVRQFDWMGVMIFFLPIVLSSLAFQVYVRQMQAHMNNLETIIAERTQELSQLMREKDAFLAVLTHDMKTPLTTINLYANMLKSYPEILQTKPHMTDLILRSQHSLTEIVDNILDLEKLQTGGAMPMNKERLDIVPVLEFMVQSLLAHAEEKAIQIHTDIQANPIIVEADRQQMERILQNLITNGIKYTPKEGQLFVSALINGDTAAVHIRDTGYGIPEEELPYIFDRFRRVAKHENKAAGTGLGLAITRALVEAHSGALTVTSQEGVGSTFTVSLPIRITH